MVSSRQDNENLMYIWYLSTVTCFGHLRSDDTTPGQDILTGGAQASRRASRTVSARNQADMASTINTIFINYLRQDGPSIVRQSIPTGYKGFYLCSQ
jgi:hypothetical protein